MPRTSKVKEASKVLEQKIEPKEEQVFIETPELKCSTCGKRITNTTGLARFLCPNCGKFEIIRCKHCRETAAKYYCPLCKFSGPN